MVWFFLSLFVTNYSRLGFWQLRQNGYNWWFIQLPDTPQNHLHHRPFQLVKAGIRIYLARVQDDVLPLLLSRSFLRKYRECPEGKSSSWL